MRKDVLDEESYEALALQALGRAGVPGPEARALLRSRFPMSAEDCLAEARGRGLALTVEDLADFLASKFGQPVNPDEVGWMRRQVNELLTWAVANERGEAPDPTRQVLTVAEMLQALRAPDLATRAVGGSLLAYALGAGLAMQGEHREDFEMLIAPELSTLLGRAMSGEAAACDELETLVTADLPEKLRRKEAK